MLAIKLFLTSSLYNHVKIWKIVRIKKNGLNFSKD